MVRDQLRAYAKDKDHDAAYDVMLRARPWTSVTYYDSNNGKTYSLKTDIENFISRVSDISGGPFSDLGRGFLAVCIVDGSIQMVTHSIDLENSNPEHTFTQTAVRDRGGVSSLRCPEQAIVRDGGGDCSHRCPEQAVVRDRGGECSLYENSMV